MPPGLHRPGGRGRGRRADPSRRVVGADAAAEVGLSRWRRRPVVPRGSTADVPASRLRPGDGVGRHVSHGHPMVCGRPEPGRARDRRPLSRQHRGRCHRRYPGRLRVDPVDWNLWHDTGRRRREHLRRVVRPSSGRCRKHRHQVCRKSPSAVSAKPRARAPCPISLCPDGSRSSCLGSLDSPRWSTRSPGPASSRWSSARRPTRSRRQSPRSSSASRSVRGLAPGWSDARTVRRRGWRSSSPSRRSPPLGPTRSPAGRFPARSRIRSPASSNLFEDVLRQGALLTASLILPTAICMGAAFPLALAIARRHQESAAGRFGIVYAVNTLGAVSGSLAAGFLLHPRVRSPLHADRGQRSV